MTELDVLRLEHKFIADMDLWGWGDMKDCHAQVLSYIDGANCMAAEIIEFLTKEADSQQQEMRIALEKLCRNGTDDGPSSICVSA